MTRVFVETTHHSAFRYGGWGIAREIGGVVSGYAGGERSITAPRLDLTALITALEGVPMGEVAIHSASPGVIAAVKRLIQPPAPGLDEAPSEDLDLWAKLLKAGQGRTLTIKAPGAPVTAFLKAWAEVGRDKAKGKGRFDAAIPKPNLARLVLPA